jgi:hypothetical protein
VQHCRRQSSLYSRPLESAVSPNVQVLRGNIKSVFHEIRWGGGWWRLYWAYVTPYEAQGHGDKAVMNTVMKFRMHRRLEMSLSAEQLSVFERLCFFAVGH